MRSWHVLASLRGSGVYKLHGGDLLLNSGCCYWRSVPALCCRECQQQWLVRVRSLQPWHIFEQLSSCMSTVQGRNVLCFTWRLCMHTMRNWNKLCSLWTVNSSCMHSLLKWKHSTAGEHFLHTVPAWNLAQWNWRSVFALPCWYCSGVAGGK